jgi:lipoic acid synthetase
MLLVERGSSRSGLGALVAAGYSAMVIAPGTETRSADGRGSDPSPPARAPVTIEAVARARTRHPRPAGGDPLRRVDRPAYSLTPMVLSNRPGGFIAAPRAKPPWLRARLPGGPAFMRLRELMRSQNLHTVCEEASCPNMGECWSRGVATIMILGDTCTRACGFCNVRTGRPGAVDADEPRRVAESLAAMGLRHVVITSVNRDELPDGGASVWAETIVRTRRACPEMTIEVLIPDFEGNRDALQMVIDAGPNIINHNLETVRRMYPAVRPSAKFDRSLELLRRVKEQGVVAKTGIMVGIGEHDEEVLGLMDEVIDMTRTGASSCDILTIGQYLQPTLSHLPIARWVHPETFGMYRAEGLRRGFRVVESGPLVRSSYHADQQAGGLGTRAAGERY